MIRRVLQVITIVATLVLLLAELIASCNSSFNGSTWRRCPDNPATSYLTTWISGHRITALCVAVAYALAVVVLFAPQIPAVLKDSIQSRFAMRAAAFAVAGLCMLLLARYFRLW